MGQARPIEITFMIDENLGLVNEAPESCGMYDAVAIPLVFTTIRRFAFRIDTAFPDSSWAAYGASEPMSVAGLFQ